MLMLSENVCFKLSTTVLIPHRYGEFYFFTDQLILQNEESNFPFLVRL